MPIHAGKQWLGLGRMGKGPSQSRVCEAALLRFARRLTFAFLKSGLAKLVTKSGVWICGFNARLAPGSPLIGAKLREMRMRVMSCVIFCCVSSTLCLAQDQPSAPQMTPSFTRCMEAVDLGAMKISQWSACYQQEYKRQDAFLNFEYQALRSRSSASNLPGLTAAQRAWISYRDAWCKYEGTLDVAPSPELNGLACLVEVTAGQVRKLKTVF